MSIISYPAFFYPELDGRFVAVFPDLPYVMTWGNDFLDTYRMAIDALAGYIDICRQEGDPIPDPSNPLTLKEEEENCFVVVVTVDVDHYIETVFNAPKSEEEIFELENDVEDLEDVEFPDTYTKKLLEILNLPE